jgi:hypothetical protein
MTLKLADLLEIADKLPEVPSELRVSMKIWEQITYGGVFDRVALNALAFTGVPVILEPHYRPDWWSEHYAEKTILHREDGVVTFPAISTHNLLRPIPKKFKIKKEPE